MTVTSNYPMKSKLVTFLLCSILGYLGIHRFYTGKIWTGLLYLFTGGLWGFGVAFDIVVLLFNSYKDKNGVSLKNDLPTFLIIIFAILWAIISFIVWSLGVVGGLIGWVFGLIF